MPTAFNVIATLIAKPGQQATLETLLRGLLEPTRLEPGCQRPSGLWEAKNPRC